ncbi:MAG TPA: LysE family translocator [Candidatus Eisenbacteria bacterium]|jgi:threonine/homoserine/homoserine lactone efflux protein
MDASFPAFLLVSAIVIVTPGQDTVLTIRNTLLGGRPGGLFTALGVAAGQAVWTLAASAGVAALLLASKPAFAAVKLVGAGYLIYLGAKSLASAFRPGDYAPHPGGGEPAPGAAPWVALRQGLLSNLGNPKMAVFFTSLLPQFAPRGQASFSALLFLGLTFCSLTLAWLSAYALLLARAGDFLRRRRVRRTLDGAAGATLVALGLRLAAERR